MESPSQGRQTVVMGFMKNRLQKYDRKEKRVCDQALNFSTNLRCTVAKWGVQKRNLQKGKLRTISLGTRRVNPNDKVKVHNC